MKQLLLDIIAHWLFLPKTKKSSATREYIHIYIHILFFEGSLRAEFGAHIQVKDGERPLWSEFGTQRMTGRLPKNINIYAMENQKQEYWGYKENKYMSRK